MDMDLSHGTSNNTIRSFNGCWTCRLRRKKCDEKNPVCDTCTALHITCYYNQDKPKWMDGGVRQDEMAERLKREVKGHRHQRASYIAGDRVSVAESTTSDLTALHQRLPRDLPIPPRDLLKDILGSYSDGTDPVPEANLELQRGADCTLTAKDAGSSIPLGRSCTILLMFYIEHLFPYLFPFYSPSILQGGRAWILEMMMSSPVVRQATLCQSSTFFSLARGTANNVICETILKQTTDAFGVLRQALQVIDGSDIREHLYGAVRIMTSIMQLQRFEVTVLSFQNCQSHLNAALALFERLLDSADAIETVEPNSSFNSSFKSLMGCLGPSAWILPTYCVQVPSAEQAAFYFSSALLVLDDIVASTVLQEQPRLYKYHHSLLGGIGDSEPSIDLEATVGCQNWALLQIGEIAVLDAWKQQCKKVGNLDVMELVHRATVIKDFLEARLTRLETNSKFISREGISLLDVFTADSFQQSETPASQSFLVTRVWAHAALIYLFVVVSGWQPASNDVRYNVGRIIELLTHQLSPPALLRTMVWPFCVAGCLAEPTQEAHLREMVKALQPPSVFGTVRKALEIMETVWSNKDEDTSSRDLATCFRNQGDLVLLV